MTFASSAAARLRHSLEEALAPRIPGALSFRQREQVERLSCGVPFLDEALRGGLCLGAITELVGPECSGRTSLAQAHVAASIQSGNVAAWIDVDDRLEPASAAEAGVDWTRLLWVRCGENKPAQATALATMLVAEKPSVEPKPLPVQGGGSPHPRSEGQGMSEAIEALLVQQPRSAALPRPRRDRVIGTPSAPNRSLASFGPLKDREEQVPTDRQPSRRAAAQMRQNVPHEPRCAEPQPRVHAAKPRVQTRTVLQMRPSGIATAPRREAREPWKPLDQALRAADLLLQTGGFALIVLDFGSTPAEMSWRIPLATWFRFRAACERTRTTLLVLTQHPCARSSAGMVARMDAGSLVVQGGVVVGLQHHVEVQRNRFEPPVSRVVPIRKPPQSVSVDRDGRWKGTAPWAI